MEINKYSILIGDKQVETQKQLRNVHLEGFPKLVPSYIL
jgi:hypothetical protein